ncbi:MAG: hypothetical protein ACE37F_34725 [Nannocystaceae bacterium]|nr:hypothetical protein [bacterium]
MTLYDVTGRSADVRLRLHHHQLELSASPLARWGDTAAHDRLFVGVSTHRVVEMHVEDVDVHPGGVGDTVAELGYGMEHPLGARWAIAWRASGRYAWVFEDTQRMASAALRLSFEPRPAHALWAGAQLYMVHRDEGAVGGRPRLSAHGVFEGQYAWMSDAGVGPFVGARLATHFGSATTPVFETRAAAVDSAYGEVTVGLRVHFR